MKRGEIWWTDLGPYRPLEQTGRQPAIIWQSDALTRVLHSILVVPLTTNLDRARLAGTALIEATEKVHQKLPLPSPSKCVPCRKDASPSGSEV